MLIWHLFSKRNAGSQIKYTFCHQRNSLINMDRCCICYFNLILARQLYNPLLNMLNAKFPLQFAIYWCFPSSMFLKLLTRLGFFQCAFVTIEGLKWLSRFLAIFFYLPQTTSCSFTDFYRFGLNSPSHGRQLTGSHCDTCNKAASLLTAPMTEKMLELRKAEDSLSQHVL